MNQAIVVQGKTVGKFRGSILLFKETFRFLSLDKEMLLVPVIACFLEIVLLGGIVIALMSMGFLGFLTGSSGTIHGVEFLGIFLSYVISAYIIAWTQAAIAHIVYTRAHGGNASLGEGISVAFSNTPALLIWSIMTSTVGIILRALAERSEILGKIIAALLGAAWAILTYFVVPSIVVGKRGAFEAIRDSAVVFRKTWGETFITNVSFSFVFFIIFVLFLAGLVGIGFLMGWTFMTAVTLLVMFVLGTFTLSLLGNTMSGVLRTLLYIYAAEGKTPENFNPELLEQIIARKTTTSMPSGMGTSVV